jgi:LysR family transcriptional regulator, nitrogen assimilation regulatory protein
VYLCEFAIGMHSVPDFDLSAFRSRRRLWDIAMNSRQLRFFLQVAELGSVTRAASALYIAQPALSRQIQQLEDELGVTLFHRSDKGVTLTDAGRLLRERAIPLVRHLERVHQEVRDEYNEPSGELTLAIPPSMADLLILPAITQFRLLHPNVTLRVVEYISGVINAWAMVQQGNVDLGVVTDYEPWAGLVRIPFIQEPLCVIGPRDAGLDFAKPLDLKEVADLTLILPSRPNTFRLIIETALSEQRLPLKIAAEINTPKLIVAAVEAGLGFAVTAYCASHARLVQKEVSVAPIRDQMVSWSIIHSRESHLSRAGKLMQELFVSIARNRIDSGHWKNAKLPS